MMKQQRQSLKKTFSFRRRQNTGTDDDDDLLWTDKEPLNPSALSRTPMIFKSLTFKRTRSSPSPLKLPKSSPLKLPNVLKQKTTPKTFLKRSNKGAFPSPQNKSHGIKSPLKQKQKKQEQSYDTDSNFAQQDFDAMVLAAQALDNTGNAFFAKNQFAEALTSYTKALKLKRRSLKFGIIRGTDNAQQLLASVATSINNIGYLRQRSGGIPEEIMAGYQDSLQIKREILGNQDLSVGKTLNNIGSVYFGTRSYSDAMTAYTEAKGIMMTNLGSSHLDVATVHSNIGDVYLAQRQLPHARDAYKASLQIRWAALGDHHPKVVRLLEKIAAIEMADTPEKMQQIVIYDEEEDKADSPVQKDLRELRQEVEKDVSYVDNVKRQLALEMIRDKIQMMREMRELDGNETRDSAASLSKEERTSAISAVKLRVESLKKRKEKERADDEASSVDISMLSMDSAIQTTSNVAAADAQMNLQQKFENACREL